MDSTPLLTRSQAISAAIYLVMCVGLTVAGASTFVVTFVWCGAVAWAVVFVLQRRRTSRPGA
jgi:fatty acid desaturase